MSDEQSKRDEIERLKAEVARQTAERQKLAGELERLVVGRTATHDQIQAMLRSAVRTSVQDDDGYVLRLLEFCKQQIDDSDALDSQDEPMSRVVACIAYEVVSQMQRECFLESIENKEGD